MKRFLLKLKWISWCFVAVVFLYNVFTYSPNTKKYFVDGTWWNTFTMEFKVYPAEGVVNVLYDDKYIGRYEGCDVFDDDHFYCRKKMKT